jgi:hypothetical protein
MMLSESDKNDYLIVLLLNVKIFALISEGYSWSDR